MVKTNSNGFTLTEVLIAMVLTSMIILAATSMDTVARRFFTATQRESDVQDEARIAMAHIVKHLQQGIGNRDNPGFTIFGGGSVIQVNLDGNNDGKYEGSPPDLTIRYRLNGNRILYHPNVTAMGVPEENITDAIVTDCIFSHEQDILGDDIPNQVRVTIIVREDPTAAESLLQNPQTTLTSSIVLRAMSCN